MTQTIQKSSKNPLVLSLAFLCMAPAIEAAPEGFQSTLDGQRLNRIELRPSEATQCETRIVLDQLKPGQTIKGFGGCFNEKGWEALQVLTSDERRTVLADLFAPGQGCDFTLARTPMGANDYSIEWYSYCEAADDFGLSSFDISHDRKFLLPYIKAAQALQPGLEIWASPWCPPSWMKTNRHYAGRPDKVNDLKPEGAGEEMRTQFRMEPRVLNAYANYFLRYLSAYANEGVRISMVHVQNEMNSCQNFPSCVWRPEDLALFISEYLGPLLSQQSPGTQIWLGTVERSQLERVEPILAGKAGQYIKGVGMQWAGKGLIQELHRLRPDLPLMQTESECGDGSNSWEAAEHLWSLMTHYLGNGAQAYMYWNMVLDESGVSRWGWKQNALISINRSSKAIRYNPEFYLMKHVSHWVRPGAVSLLDGAASGDWLAFRNADGSTILVYANVTGRPVPLSLTFKSRGYMAELPPRSFTTFVF